MVDVKKLPVGVLAALRNRERSDTAIADMTLREIFNEYCTWHGLVGWGDDLWQTAAALRDLDPKSAEAPHVVVQMDGGVIQGIVSAQPIQVSVIDYNPLASTDEDDLHEIPQKNGEMARAYVTKWSADVEVARAAELIEAVAAPTVGERSSMKP